MGTPAIRWLKQRKIPFDIRHYDHDRKGAAFAAASLNFPLEQTIKTLVVDLAGGRFCLALMPGDRQLDLKLLAACRRVKRAVMADTADAERLTGYRVGGISPFGTRQPLPVVMEASLLKWSTVLLNAGQRGTMLIMSPQAIANALNCEVTPIAKPEK